jgi:DNA-binding response OmpR family regulator
MSDISTAAPPVSVLVIEDVMDTADSLARFLHVGSGLEVRVAYNGETGVKMAFADPPSVVICDIGLPRLNGLRVAAEIAELKPKPLLIAVTAYGGVYPEETALAAGFDHYLVKPADPFAIEKLILDHARSKGQSVGGG